MLTHIVKVIQILYSLSLSYFPKQQHQHFCLNFTSSQEPANSCEPLLRSFNTGGIFQPYNHQYKGFLHLLPYVYGTDWHTKKTIKPFPFVSLSRLVLKKFPIECWKDKVLQKNKA